MNKVLVSVICTNFNKGDWIADALEGFLKQKTNFTYEILVIDDSSTDHSVNIIKKYEESHPQLVRAFYNEENIGITKTWIKVCKEARGEYIARCDGDDFWSDTSKLQKQVDALRSNPGSLWSSTDFDIILPDGTKTYESAFEKGVMIRSNSYENVLATKGFTMSSTWLVDTELMNSINRDINIDTIDDTFDIQIELFYRTKLTYLPEATTVYRVGYESDSNPADILKAKQRNERLLKTQLSYIDKYKKDINLSQIAKISFEANNNLEAILLDKKAELLSAATELARARVQIKSQQNSLEEYDRRIKEIQNSKRYKLAKIFVYPKIALKKMRDR